jgi:hypothetical protein
MLGQPGQVGWAMPQLDRLTGAGSNRPGRGLRRGRPRGKRSRGTLGSPGAHREGRRGRRRSGGGVIGGGGPQYLQGNRDERRSFGACWWSSGRRGTAGKGDGHGGGCGCVQGGEREGAREKKKGGGGVSWRCWGSPGDPSRHQEAGGGSRRWRWGVLGAPRRCSFVPMKKIVSFALSPLALGCFLEVFKQH